MAMDLSQCGDIMGVPNAAGTDCECMPEHHWEAYQILRTPISVITLGLYPQPMPLPIRSVQTASHWWMEYVWKMHLPPQGPHLRRLCLAAQQNLETLSQQA